MQNDDRLSPEAQAALDAARRNDTMNKPTKSLLIDDERRELVQRLAAENEQLRAALAEIAAYDDQWMSGTARVMRDRARAALPVTYEQKASKTYTAGNGEELPNGVAGTTIVNDGRPT